METSYEEVSREAKVPKLGLGPLEVTAGLRDIDAAEAEAEADDDKSWVEGGLPAIVVAPVVGGESADAALAAYVVIEKQTGHVAFAVGDLVDMEMPLFCLRRALLHTLWELGRSRNVALMSVVDLAAARPVAV